MILASFYSVAFPDICFWVSGFFFCKFYDRVREEMKHKRKDAQ